MEKTYGKSVFITGGSSGIGLACAVTFAGEGYEVFAASRRPADKERRFPGGGRIVPVRMDVRDEDSVKDAAALVLSRAQDLGIVIHCAGFSLMGPAEQMPSELVHLQLETNFFGVTRVNRHLLPALRSRGAGLCLIIGSVAGLFPVPFQAYYCASKFALEGYAGALRSEIGHYGVRVTLLEPGPTKTGFTAARKFDVPKDSPYGQAACASVEKMQREEGYGKSPETVARAALRLSRRRNPPVRTTVCLAPAAQSFLRRLLPSRAVQWLLGRLYMPFRP